MKYHFMVIVDEKRLQAMSETEAQTVDYVSLELRCCSSEGRSLPAGPSARVRQHRRHSADSERESIDHRGPFAETKEQIGGFIVIEANDLDEAIQLASHIPAVRPGTVKVRPIKELVQQQPTAIIVTELGGNVTH